MELDALLERLEKPIFDEDYQTFSDAAKTPPSGQDVVTASGNNLYEKKQSRARTPRNLRSYTR